MTGDGSPDERVAELMEQAAGKLRLAAEQAHEDGDSWDGGLMMMSTNIRGMAAGRRGQVYELQKVDDV